MGGVPALSLCYGKADEVMTDINILKIFGDGIVTHIAGPEIVVQGRWMRQRCSWCGAILINYDLDTVASSDGKQPGSFEVGKMVDVSGISPVWCGVNNSNTLPSSFCGHEETGGM